MRPMDLKTQKRKKKKGKVKKSHDENLDPLSGSSKSVQYSVDDLIDLAEGYLDKFEYDSAQRVIQNVLEIDADNPRALETAATLLIEGGDRTRALQCLGRAITVSPLKGYSKYFSIGQLLEGRQALEAYLKGIEVLLKKKEENSDEEVASACGGSNSKSDLSKELSTAYICISELWMTDLCDEDDAESQCEQAIHHARQADATNPEPLQQLANFLLIKGELDGAKSTMEESVSLWLPQMRASAAGNSDDPVEVCSVSLPTRFAAAKILIELEEWDIATEILELILEEDEDSAECWYLLGWLNYLRRENFEGNARFYLNKALQVAKNTSFENEDIIEHTNQLLAELGDAEDKSDDEYEDIDSEASSSEDEQ